MPRAKKNNIEVRIIIDSREKDLSYIQSIRWDKEFKSDKIKISGYKIKVCKPVGCKTSTGDITIEYKFEDETKWRKTNLSVERKGAMDIFSTLYSSYKRFDNELTRAEKADLDFYILHDYTFKEVKTGISRLQNMRKLSFKSMPYYTFLNRYLEVSKRFPIICTGQQDFTVVLRRLIKLHIIKNKLQYKST